MYYRNKEERDNAVKRHIEDYRNAAGLFSRIRPIIESFDNKVFNCRLEKALQEKTGLRIYAKKDFKHISIYMYGGNTNRMITLASIPLEALKEEKRIPAAAFIEDARKRRESLLKEAASMEEAITKADTVKRQMDALQAQMEAVSKQISSYTAREIYGLNYRITYN